MKKNFVLVLCLALLAMPLLNATEEAEAQLADVLEIRFIDWDPQHNSNGSMIMVTGYFQEVFVNASGTNASLEFTYNEGGSGLPSENNTYTFVKNDTGWHDPLYGRFINASMCSATPDNFTFGIGLNISAWLGSWNVVAKVDGAVVDDVDIVAHFPWGGSIGISSDNIPFRVEPYDTNYEVENNERQQIRLTNDGNIPMDITVSWDPGWDSVFSMTNVSNYLFPGHTYVNILFNPSASPPGSNRVQYKISGMRAHPVSDQVETYIADITTGFIAEPENTGNVDVEVKLAGYDVLDIGNRAIVMQYQEGPFTLNYEEEKTIDIYLTGADGTELNLDISAVNVTIVSITQDGVDATENIGAVLNETTPTLINITVRGDFSNAQGKLVYSISNADSSLTGEADTAFQTNPAPPGSDDEEDTGKNTMALVAIGAGFLVFILILVVYGVKRRK